jgi:hypothetical protein
VHSGTFSLVYDDLAKLRKDYPGWNFGSVWASAARGPDARRLWATREGMLLSAWTAAELARNIRQEEKGYPEANDRRRPK